MNIQETAPYSIQYEWKWSDKYHKWLRFPAKDLQKAYVQMLNAKFKATDAKDTNYQNAQRRYNQLANHIQSGNQEANAWGHKNYDDFHYYKTDTLHAPNYQQFLAGMSDDQLNHGYQYWRNQLYSQHKFKNYDPTKDDNHYNDVGDLQRFNIHYDYLKNISRHTINNTDNDMKNTDKWLSKNVPVRPGASSIDSIDKKYIPKNLWPTENNKIGQYVNDLTNEEKLKVELDNCTHHGNDWSNIKDQLHQVQAKENKDLNTWQLYTGTSGTGGGYRVKPGENYTTLARKFGVSINYLRNQMKYPDRDIPVGSVINIPTASGNSKVMKNFRSLLGAVKSDVKGSLGADIAAIDHDKVRIQQYQRFMQKRHQQEINDSIRNQLQQNSQSPIAHTMGNHDGPYWTSIYRQDKKTDTVARIAELQPQEEWSLNANQHSVDGNMPETDFAQINQGQLTDQGVIYGKSDQDRVQQYNVLRQWMFDKRRLVIVGFNHWQPILITDFQRSPRQEATDNGLNVSITFQFIRTAHIKYAKQKPAQGKSRGRNRRNNKKKSPRKIKIRPGDTYWGAAQKYHIPLKSVMGANHYKARDLPVGGTMNIP